MNIQLTCPYCRFSKELPETAIPATAKRAVCPQCGQQFLFSRPRNESPSAAPPLQPSAATPAEAPEGEATDAGPAPPWECRDELGFWHGFFQTVKAVLFSSETFFKPDSHPSNRGIRDPLTFGLLTGSLGSMAGFFWQTLLMLAGITAFGGTFMGHLTRGLIFGILLLVIPVVVFLGMFIYGWVLHILVRMVGAGKDRFEGTFRVVAYSQAVQLVAFIPFVGGWVAGIWQLIVQIIGLRTIHRTSYARVILAFLIPLAVCSLIAVTAVVVVPLLLLRVS